MRLHDRWITVWACTSAVIGIAGTAALADDFAPPAYRGGSLSVMAEWEFMTPPTDWYFIAPDTFSAVGPSGALFDGFPTHAEVDLPSNWMWHPGDGDGAITPAPGLPGGASIAFKMQNWEDILWTKMLRLQVTWSGQVAPTTIGLDGWIGTALYFGQLDGSAVVDGNHYYEDWVIHPNPWWEVLVLQVPQGTSIDEVIIDTISIPSPGGAILGVLGAAMMFRRRR